MRGKATNIAIYTPGGAKMEEHAADGRELRRWIKRNLHRKTLLELQAAAGHKFGVVPTARLVQEVALTMNLKGQR